MSKALALAAALLVLVGCTAPVAHVRHRLSQTAEERCTARGGFWRHLEGAWHCLATDPAATR